MSKLVVKLVKAGPQGAAGVSNANFLQLTDTPADYTGAANYHVVVNATADGLTFATGAGAGDMTKAIYDPNTVEGDVFDMDNMVQGAINFFLNATQHGNLHAPGSDDQVAGDFNHDDLANITGTIGEYNHPTDAQMGNLHAHSNKANLDVIDQDLATTDDVTFNMLTANADVAILGHIHLGNQLTGVNIREDGGDLEVQSIDVGGVCNFYLYGNNTPGSELLAEMSWSGLNFYLFAYGDDSTDIIIWPQGDNIQFRGNIIPNNNGNDIGVSGGTTWDNLYLDETAVIGGALSADTVTTDLIQFDLTAAETVAQGQLAWNADEETLDLGQNGTTLQLGQEFVYHVNNNSGAQIDDGKPVMATGTLGASGQITIGLMDATDHDNEKYFLGIATETIANGASGKITSQGKIRGLDTTGTLSFGGLETWNDGDILYLDPANVGYLTNVEPTDLDTVMPVAFVIHAHATVGVLYVRVTNHDLNHYVPRTQQALTKDPTGWVDNTAITSTYDSTTRTVTLTGDLRYFWQGVLKELTSPHTFTAHPATLDNTYFLYSTDGDTFSWSTSVWNFDQLMVGFVFYGTNDKYAVVETHGLMPWQAHREFHERQGTYKVSGGTLSDYTLSSTTATDRRPDVSETVLQDEDISTTLPLQDIDTVGTTQYYLTGAGPTTELVPSAADIVPLSGNQPYWNENNGGTWQQTLMANNSFQSLWLVGVPVTSDSGSQAYRFWWVQGQSNPSTLLGAEAETLFDLTLTGIPTITPEFTFLAHVVIQYTAANWSIASVNILNGTRSQVTSGPAGNYLSIVSSDATLDGTGTSGDPLSVANPAEVFITGTPVDDQIAVWTSAANIEGTTGLTYDGSTLGVTGGLSASGAVTGSNLSGTNTGDQDIDDVTPTTTKGDLLVENGSNVVRLPVGTDTHVLTADAAEASGVKWAAAAAGGGDVTKVGTPVNNELAVWTGDGTLEGEANITYDGITFLFNGEFFEVSGATEANLDLIDENATADRGRFRMRSQSNAFYLGVIADSGASSSYFMYAPTNGAVSTQYVKFQNINHVEAPELISVGNVKVNSAAVGVSGDGVVAISESTAPITSPADVVQLYAGDVQAAAGNMGLLIRNETGTITQLGHASIFPGNVRVDGALFLTDTDLIVKKAAEDVLGLEAPTGVRVTINSSEVAEFDSTGLDITGGLVTSGYIDVKGITDELTATAANTFAAGEIGIYVAAGTVTKCDADAEATTKGMLVMATEAITASTSGTFLIVGKVTGLTGLTQGSTYYVSTTTGAITATAPSATGDFVRVVGHALSTTEFMFNPSQTWIEVA